jgi:hypothetical protein
MHIPVRFWYTRFIPRIFVAYTIYINNAYLRDIYRIYNVYNWNIHCLYKVYVRDVYCTFIRYTTGSTSNHIACTSDNFYFAKLLSTLGILALVDVDAQGASGAINSREALEEGVAAETRNKMSYQEYTRYIPGIFKVYTKSLPVDKLLIPVAGLAQRLL